MLHLVQKHFLQFCHLSKYLCRAVSTPRCLLVKRNGETFKAEQAAQSLKPFLFPGRSSTRESREGWGWIQRRVGVLTLDLASIALKTKTLSQHCYYRGRGGRIATERDSAMLQKLKKGFFLGRVRVRNYFCHFQMSSSSFYYCLNLSPVARPRG